MSERKVRNTLLSAAECAAAVRCAESAWWGIARDDRILCFGWVEFRRKTSWTADAVERFIEVRLRAGCLS